MKSRLNKHLSVFHFNSNSSCHNLFLEVKKYHKTLVLSFFDPKHLFSHQDWFRNLYLEWTQFNKLYLQQVMLMKMFNTKRAIISDRINIISITSYEWQKMIFAQNGLQFLEKLWTQFRNEVGKHCAEWYKLQQILL